MQISPRCDRMIAASFRDRGARHVRKAGMLRLTSGCGARSVESGKPATSTGFPLAPRGEPNPAANLRAQQISGYTRRNVNRLSVLRRKKIGKPAKRTGFPRMPRGGSTPTAYLKAQSLSSQALTGCQPPDAGKIKFFKKTPISALRAMPVRLHDAFVAALQHLVSAPTAASRALWIDPIAIRQHIAQVGIELSLGVPTIGKPRRER